MNAGIFQPSSQCGTPPRSIGGAPARPAQTPGGIDGALEWRRPNWPVAQDAVCATVRTSNWAYGTRASAATISAVTNNYVGTVLAQDGLVWATPFAATGGLVFDANNNRTYVVGSFGASANFNSGVLLNDGRIFVVPRSSTTARIVDIVNRTVVTPGGTFPGSTAYAGGCLFDGGRKIYLAPALRTTAGVYDLQRETLTTPAGTFSFDNIGSVSASSGCMLLPDGRVLVFPGYNTAAIYDPVKDTLTQSSLTLGGNLFFGGVLLPNGDEVLLVPFLNGTAVQIYNWKRDTARTVAGTVTGHIGGQLAPDGSVFLVPGSSTSAKYYRPETDTVTVLPDTYSGSNPAAGCHTLPDGRVCMMPRSDSAVRTYGTRGPSFDQHVTLSPFYNHR